MTRPPRRPRPLYVPTPPEPQLTTAQLDAIADRILADGDVYQAGSVNECAALLAVLRERRYIPKHRTANEINAAPWLLIVVPEEVTIALPSTIEPGRLDKRHPATAQPIPCAAENELNRKEE